MHYDSQSGMYKYKAWIRLPGGLTTIVFTWARNQIDARKMILAQYNNCDIVGSSVQHA